ncbi:MAG: Hsp20/alpha crystallin family protein, partial [Thermoleophilia bacterium]|nr:Hsp20/alpha crystallin family protein [Thermoleophilia bacterium]
QREKVAEESGDRFYRFERRYGTFSRAVGLPQGADESKIAASYEDGVLEIRVPKPEEAKPRKIALGNAKPDIEG